MDNGRIFMPKLNLIVLRTNQAQKLAALYELLGLEFDYHQHGNGPFHYSAILGEVVFEIYPLRKSQTKSDDSLRLGFQVSNLDKTIEKLRSENIRIIAFPEQGEWGYRAVIQDLDGRKIELTQS
ncbi:MAG: VOC family protein [Bacteroidota bacterium]